VAKLFKHSKPAANREERLAALLHDAPEYVIGDMISPFKAALGVDYKAFEHKLLAAIHVRFGLPATISNGLTTAIKQADRTAAYLEATQLAGFSVAEAGTFFGVPKGLGGFDATLVPQAPNEAAAEYLSLFRILQVVK
jgi:uncharacterized protein